MASRDMQPQASAICLKAPASMRDRAAAFRITTLTIAMQLVIRAMLFLRAWNY